MTKFLCRPIALNLRETLYVSLDLAIRYLYMIRTCFIAVYWVGGRAILFSYFLHVTNVMLYQTTHIIYVGLAVYAGCTLFPCGINGASAPSYS